MSSKNFYRFITSVQPANTATSAYQSNRQTCFPVAKNCTQTAFGHKHSQINLNYERSQHSFRALKKEIMSAQGKNCEGSRHSLRAPRKNIASAQKRNYERPEKKLRGLATFIASARRFRHEPSCKSTISHCLTVMYHKTCGQVPYLCHYKRCAKAEFMHSHASKGILML